MKILIKARHIELDGQLQKYAHEKLSKLEKFVTEPATLDVAFEDVRGGLKAGRDKLVRLTASLPGEKKAIHIEELDDDFRAAIDLAEHRLRNALERYHDRDKGLFRHIWRRVFKR